MKTWIRLLFLVTSLPLLSGCWNREELPEKAFVMGVAIAKPAPDKIKLMVQIFKPSQKTAGKGGDSSSAFSNIETIGTSTFEAIRDTTLRLGRKTQWGHTRIIIIDEQTATSTNLLSLLELFYRDHETRITTKVVIAQEDSDTLLMEKPMIELTSSQQMNRMQELSNRVAGKAPDTNLLKLARDLKSEVGDAAIPLITKTDSNELAMQGTAIIHRGKMIGTLNSKHTQDMLMLSNQFRAGVIKIPCKAEGKPVPQLNESLEAQKIHSIIKPVIAGDSLRVRIQVLVQGNIAEMHCTQLKQTSNEVEYLHYIEQVIQQRLMETVKLTQRKKVDLLGIGNMIYRKHNRIWKQWKPDWDTHYAEAQFDIKVKVELDNTLTTVGKPLYTQ